MNGKLIQINTKSKVEGEVGLPKIPQDKAKVTFMGLEGDYNNYRFTSKGNTPNRAILIMPIEMMTTLQNEGWEVKPGDLGENFTTSGIEYNQFKIGDKYKVGNIKIEISEACFPCNSLGVLKYVGKDKVDGFKDTMKGRRGWYAKVLQEGEVKPGDLIESI